MIIVMDYDATDHNVNYPGQGIVFSEIIIFVSREFPNSVPLTPFKWYNCTINLFQYYPNLIG